MKNRFDQFPILQGEDKVISLAIIQPKICCIALKYNAFALSNASVFHVFDCIVTRYAPEFMHTNCTGEKCLWNEKLNSLK